MTNKLGDFLLYGMIVAGIVVMTRPKSQGPALVTNLGDAFSSVIKAASGQGLKY